MNCSEFYRGRDLRTSQYVANWRQDSTPVFVSIDAETAASPAGQLALLGLGNQLARVHPRVLFSVPDLATTLPFANRFEGPTLRGTLLSMMTCIDPCGEFRLSERPKEPAVSIGLGDRVGAEFDWYLGADGSKAQLAKHPAAFSPSLGTLRGAALAACIGATAVFRTTLGLDTVPRVVSCWNYAEGKEASLGPETLEPVDVGRVLVVGAGAVAASLVYWLSCFGVAGPWTFVDRDHVKIHNLNRGLIFAASDAGWPDGLPRGKAELLATQIPEARWDANWYHESKLAEEQYDVVLGLANDLNARHFLASRNNVVTLHATTGTSWLSQLHRHVLGLDDCIWCRAGEVVVPVLSCSTAEVKTSNGEKNDAALPFLSAASGLMLATALQRLQCGELPKQVGNDWRWDFDSPYKMAMYGRRKCRDDCARVLPAAVRRQLNQGSRWSELDS